MSETTAGVKWEPFGGRDDIIYRGDGFYVRVRSKYWWASNGDSNDLLVDLCAPDHATAKRDAERWILEREGRLPAPATDGGGWIACSERMPENDDDVEVIAKGWFSNGEWHSYPGSKISQWRPRPVDPHAVAACLFDDTLTTAKKIRAAARHVAGCAECRAKLESKGGA